KTNWSLVDAPLLSLPAVGWTGNFGDWANSCEAEKLSNVARLAFGSSSTGKIVVLRTDLLAALCTTLLGQAWFVTDSIATYRVKVWESNIDFPEEGVWLHRMVRASLDNPCLLSGGILFVKVRGIQQIRKQRTYGCRKVLQCNRCATCRRPCGFRVPTYCSIYSHRSEEHTSELQSRENLVCRLLLEKKKNKLNS